jgi:hypothetical protein
VLSLRYFSDAYIDHVLVLYSHFALSCPQNPWIIMSPRLHFVCLCLLLCTFIKLQAQTKTVQVTVLNGTERRCIADSIVEIQITPNQSLDSEAQVQYQ